MKAKLILSLVFASAFVLRLVNLSHFPVGFTPDEAAQGYTAYSILKTGKDEWGVRFPLNPRSFGDYKAPVYTYLSVPSVALFGLNELAVRLPAAVCGILAILTTYFLAKEIFDQNGLKEKTKIDSRKIALTAAFLLAFSPWHVSLSRGAFEANLTTFFLTSGVLFFLKGIKSLSSPDHSSSFIVHSSWFMILGSLFFGLNMLTYHSAKLITPLILMFLLAWKFPELKKSWPANKNYLVVSGTILAVFLIVTFGGLLLGGGTRVVDIGIFSGGWQAVAEKRYQAVIGGLPDAISRIFNNKLSFSWGEFIKNYFSYLSPQFLFTQGAGEATYGMIPGRGVLYLIELPLILVSLYFLIGKKESSVAFLWFWVLVAPFPASLARGVGYHANRVAVMMPAIQILSAYGLVKLLNLIKIKSFLYLFALIFSLSFASFVEDYFFQGPAMNASAMSYGWRQVMAFVNQQEDSQRVIISRGLSEPQAFIMFYNQINPKKVQSQSESWLEYEKIGNFVDQLGEYRLGNYEFRNLRFPEDWQGGGVILIGTDKDFWGQENQIERLRKNFSEEKIIKYPNDKIAFRIFVL